MSCISFPAPKQNKTKEKFIVDRQTEKEMNVQQVGDLFVIVVLIYFPNLFVYFSKLRFEWGIFDFFIGRHSKSWQKMK